MKKMLNIYPSDKCPVTYNMIGTVLPSILLTEMEYRKWFYSNYIHLSAEPEFYLHETRHPLGIFPDNYIRQLNSASFSGVLQEVFLPNEVSKLGRDDIVRFVMEKIDQDFYVLIWMDVSRLQGTKWYRNRKYRHWAFCVGYDTEKNVIYVQDFDKKGKLRVLPVTAEDFADAFDSSIPEMRLPESLGFCKILGKGNLVLLKKIPDFRFQKDFCFIRQELVRYLEGTDIGRQYQLFLPYKENICWGINVYECLKEYLKI